MPGLNQGRSATLGRPKQVKGVFNTFILQYTLSFQRSNIKVLLGASISIQKYRVREKNGKLEKLKPGMYMGGGLHPSAQMENKKTELHKLKACINLLTLY